jgi:hypothetical protein
MWWARQDSNLQPDRYERPALTIELQAPGADRPAVPDRLQGGWLVCNGGSAPPGRANSTARACSARLAITRLVAGRGRAASSRSRRGGRLFQELADRVPFPAGPAGVADADLLPPFGECIALAAKFYAHPA